MAFKSYHDVVLEKAANAIITQLHSLRYPTDEIGAGFDQGLRSAADTVRGLQYGEMEVNDARS